MSAHDISPQILIENLSTAIVLLDDALRVCYFNSAAEELFGVSSRQAETITLQILLPGEDRLLASLQHVLASGASRLEHDMTLTIPNQGEHAVEYAIKLLTLPEQAPQLLLEIVQSPSQHRISRDEQLQMQQQMMRGLAHEIKNPLGGLRGAAQLLEKQLDSDDLKEDTGIIISEADRLQSLMTRMLGPHQVSEKVPVNIHEVLRRVQQLVSAEHDNRLVFQGDYDPSLPDMLGDFDQIVQVILNIVRNAVQALNGVGRVVLRTRVKRKLTVDQHHHRLALCVQIEDDGPGVPKGLQETIFYPLVTGRSDGTGLGLYLVQNLVQRNGGVITYQSEVGRTIFSIYFPLEQS